MGKTIRISLPNKKVSVVADLVEDLAPKTCKAIWNSLPQEGTATHCKTLGLQFWTGLKPTDELRKVPRENYTIYPIPGDLLYGYFPPAWEGGRRGDTEETCDFVICYGRESPTLGSEGPILFNHFGVIRGDISKLAEAGHSLHVKGADKILLEKVT